MPKKNYNQKRLRAWRPINVYVYYYYYISRKQVYIIEEFTNQMKAQCQHHFTWNNLFWKAEIQYWHMPKLTYT